MLRWLRRWRSGPTVEPVEPPPDVDPLDELRQILRDLDDSAPESWDDRPRLSARRKMPRK